MREGPRFILSRRKVIERYDIIKSISDNISYSLKTNSSAGRVLESETDSSFSVHSTESIKDIRNKSRVWFFAQAWDKEEIDGLMRAGVRRFVIDNSSDLNELLNYLKNSHMKADLLLRMRLKENTVHTGKHFVFGFYSDQINLLIKELRSNDSIGILGIHFHRKTQNISEWHLKEELEEVLEADTLDLIGVVNIGGGLPVQYKNSRAEAVSNILKRISDLRSWLNDKGIRMIIEPGRFIAAPSVKLEATIKNIYDDNIIIDASVYNGAMDTFIAHVRLLVEGELEKGEAFTIKGCTPDSLDIFRYRVYLEDPKIGDKIVFLNAGAYNFATEFCRLRKIPTIIVDSFED